ncbi:RNA-binding protein [Catenovulum sp. SM1970]|uniref:RNA recognition motif domain-containing protein n=1 Tax=Marinifaba aquimaris TaxID=2741323 RepID=UPI0015739A23|nr:RNA-binding protein [Marinifaba aquimaris]NTS78882.1 RNA-binding protein [Marinifaba aquimaris]
MSNQVKQILVSVILAVVAAVALPDLDLSSGVTLALGLLIGGIITSFITPPATATESNEAEYTGETKTLYVGNLPYRANEAAVRELFSTQGTVVSVRLMRDRNTGKRKGFGFVEMAKSDIENAIEKLNDSEFQQRTLKVREAKERPQQDQNA